MLKYLRRHIWDILTIVLLIAVGVLLLVDPATYALMLVRVIGALLILLGVWRIVRYFRTPAELAAEGSDFFTGLMAVCGGALCVINGPWLLSVFPVLAEFYGLMQILLGFQKVQRTADALRMGLRHWYLPAIGAVISLTFGVVIVMNPNMEMMSVWTFTGVTLIAEGVFDAVTLWMLREQPEQYVTAGQGGLR